MHRVWSGSVACAGLLLVAAFGAVSGAATAGKTGDVLTNWIERGNAASERGDLAEAIVDYLKATQAVPPQPVAWYDLALTYRRLGRDKDALDAVRRAVAIDDTFDRGHGLLAHVLHDSGDLPAALAAASRAIQLNAGEPDYRVRRALIEVALGRLEPAREDLSVALRAQPDRLDALHALAGVELRRGDRGRALQLLSRYLAASRAPDASEYPAVVAAYASLLNDAGRFHDALTALDAQRDDARFLTPRAQALIGLGRAVEAQALLARAPAANIDAARMQAVLAFRERRYAEAVAAFRRVVAAAPEDELSWRNLGAAELASGDPRAALAPLRTAVRLKPEDMTALRFEADALRRSGDVPGAIAATRTVLALAGDDARLFLLLGVDEYLSGDRKTGYVHYAKGCALLPTDATNERERCRRQLIEMKPT